MNNCLSRKRLERNRNLKFTCRQKEHDVEEETNKNGKYEAKKLLENQL